MQRRQQRTALQYFLTSVRVFFRAYPTILFIIKWLLICVFIGSLIGSASAGFLQSLDKATGLREHNAWIIWLLPVAGFITGAIYHYWGRDVEAGNNLLIDTIHQPAKKIPFHMALLVYTGTMLTHLFGGSAGREGTALQMGGSIADQFSKPFRLNLMERKILLMAAIAAGFGSVFGTPLAGAIFALEVILIGQLTYAAIFPVFAAAIIADIVTKAWGTTHTIYTIPSVPSVSFTGILYALIAGAVFGLCAALFSKSMHAASSFFKKIIPFVPVRAFAGGVVIATAVCLIDTTKYIGLGIPTIVDSFSIQLPVYDFAVKMLFTVFTLSVGFKGGEVTPLFFIGAVLGNALSLFIPLPMGLLAGMGFVAVFAGATNTPLACTVMAMELFGSECGVYIGIACVVSYLMSGNNTIYKSQKTGTAKHTRWASFKNL